MSTKQSEYQVIAKIGLNLRTKPNGKVIKVLSYGAHCVVLERSGDWAKINFYDSKHGLVQGWVHSGFITEVNPKNKEVNTSNLIHLNDPVWLSHAIQLLSSGVKEIPGKQDNDWIVSALKECRLSKKYLHDETPWCSAGLNKIFSECGLKGTGNATAESWLKWGRRVPVISGGICIFATGRKKRNRHVTIMVSAEPVLIGNSWRYRCVGCNQSDMIKESRYLISDLLDVRWPTKKELKRGKQNTT